MFETVVATMLLHVCSLINVANKMLKVWSRQSSLWLCCKHCHLVATLHHLLKSDDIKILTKTYIQNMTIVIHYFDIKQVQHFFNSKEYYSVDVHSRLLQNILSEKCLTWIAVHFIWIIVLNSYLGFLYILHTRPLFCLDVLLLLLNVRAHSATPSPFHREKE